MKTLLISFVSLDKVDDLLTVASGIATINESHVIGLYVTPGAITFSDEFGMNISVIEDQRLQHHQKNIEHIKSRFEEQMRRDGISFEWRDSHAVTPNIVDTLRDHSREVDLVIIGHDAPDSDGKIFDVSLTADLIMASGRPILIVPKLRKKSFSIETAVIGWKSSRESTRAAFDSVPLLKTAHEVHVLAVSSKLEKNKIQSIPQFDLAESLARHGLKISAHSIHDDRKAGLVILDFAKKQDADIVIIGAYGRSRLRERLLGGVTDYILHHATVPVLLAN